MSEHKKYIQQAYKLALKGKGLTSPNPMVGAVVVKAGKVIATGWHKRCGADHAEVDALKKIGDKARGATLHVTLEPCTHHGRTPACTDAIIKAGIKKVVIGVLDPNPVNDGKSVKILQKAGIQVEAGFLKSELAEMNEAFNKYITKKMPFVTAKCAQTLDGKIATSTGDSKWITSDQTRDYARRRRHNFDAIMVGINTVLADNPQLNPVPRKQNFKKIVVDSTLKTSLKAQLFVGTKPSNIIIATTKKASKSKIKQFTKKGVQILIAPSKGKHSHVDLRWLMKDLGKKEISNLLIEGGGRLIGRALKDGLVDKLNIYIAPKIIGDQNAISSIAGLNITKIDRALKLKDIRIEKLGEEFLLEASIVYGHR